MGNEAKKGKERGGREQSASASLSSHSSPYSCLSLYKSIVGIRENDGWFMGFGFVGCHHGIRNDDDNITNLCPAGSGSVQANNARTALTLNHIRNEPFAVVVVNNMHLLIFEQTGGIHEVFVNGYTPDVVELSLRDFDAV